MKRPEFSVGDEFVCECGNPECSKFFVITKITERLIHAVDFNGVADKFNKFHPIRKMTKLEKAMK